MREAPTDNSKRHLAYAATFQAHQTLLSARKNLAVTHLPLFGAEPDLDRVLLDLRSAHQKIAEVILLIESAPASRCEFKPGQEQAGSSISRRSQ